MYERLTTNILGGPVNKIILVHAFTPTDQDCLAFLIKNFCMNLPGVPGSKCKGCAVNSIEIIKFN